jgi:hypothetical protein
LRFAVSNKEAVKAAGAVALLEPLRSTQNKQVRTHVQSLLGALAK